MLVKIEGRRRRGQQRMKWLDNIINSVDMSLSKLWKTVKDREAWHAAAHEVAKSQTWLTDWTFQRLFYSNDHSDPKPLFAESNSCFWVLIFIDLLASLNTVEMLYEMLLFGFFLDGVFLLHFLYCSHPGPGRVLKYPNDLFFQQPSLSNVLNTVYKLSTLKFISASLTFHLIPRLIFSCLHLLAVLIGIF